MLLALIALGHAVQLPHRYRPSRRTHIHQQGTLARARAGVPRRARRVGPARGRSRSAGDRADLVGPVRAGPPASWGPACTPSTSSSGPVTRTVWPTTCGTSASLRARTRAAVGPPRAGVGVLASLARGRARPSDQAEEHPHEAWFFINGILTDGDVAKLNANYLTHCSAARSRCSELDRRIAG